MYKADILPDATEDITSNCW